MTKLHKGVELKITLNNLLIFQCDSLMLHWILHLRGNDDKFVDILELNPEAFPKGFQILARPSISTEYEEHSPDSPESE